jgi:phenylpyruvate tautomerase PptA (4-oxalocrotonate tautomerase family)
MPFVEVHWYEGRSDDQKAEIAKRIEEALVEVAGVPREHCWVRFSDASRADLIIPEGEDPGEQGD